MTIQSSHRWVRRWLVRPLCARKVLVQLGQGMMAGDEHLSAFDFLACRLVSVMMVLSFSLSREFLLLCARQHTTHCDFELLALKCQGLGWRTWGILSMCLCNYFWVHRGSVFRAGARRTAFSWVADCLTFEPRVVPIGVEIFLEGCGC